MARGWRWAVVVAVLVGVGVVGRPAAAGGSVFSFTWRYIAPGQEVHGLAEFSAGQSETGSVRDGPYDAYLLPGDRFIAPPHIPSDALLLGTVAMERVRGNLWQATLSFVVPEVKPGLYSVSLCNHPCRDNIVGDLMGAWVHVVSTPEEAHTRNLIARSAEQLDARWSEVMTGLQGQVDALREQVSASQATPTPALSDVSDRLDQLGKDLERLKSVPTVARPRDGGSGAGLWLAGWLVAAAIGGAWWFSAWRKRTAQPIGGEEPPDEGRVRPSDEETPRWLEPVR